MTDLSAITTGVLVALLLASVVTDLRSRRIPNALTVAGVVAALALRSPVGLAAVGEGLLGALLAFVLVLPLLAIGGFGGGDAKLVIAVGAFLGPKGLLTALVLAGLAGLVLAAVETVRKRAVLPILFSTGELALYLVTFGRRGARRQIESAGALTVPYGVAIAAGALGAWFL